jgi:diguanylate cyclase (GGDEF)-like protein
MVGQTLDSNSRYFDQVGRWGGEEFLAVLANPKSYRLRDVAERFRALVESSGIPQQSEVIGVTISLGGAEVREGDTIESLVNRADQNLYLAKQSGRNRACD